MTISIFNSSVEVSENINGFNILNDLRSYLQKLDDHQLENLKKDIEINGILTPVQFVLINGEKIVLDGHIRLTIAKDLGIDTIPELEIKDRFNSMEELRIWMIRNQCQRRNLNRNIRIKLAYSLKNSISELAKRNLILAGKNEQVENKIDTLNEIAKIAGVSKTTIARYQYVLEHAPDDVKNKMIEGHISVNNACESIPKGQVEGGSSPLNEEYSYKSNYSRISSAKEGEKKIKSGELDFILIIKKGKEDLIPETLNKIGLLIID